MGEGATADVEINECSDPDKENCQISPRPELDVPLAKVSYIDAAYTNATMSPKVSTESFRRSTLVCAPRTWTAM